MVSTEVAQRCRYCDAAIPGTRRRVQCGAPECQRQANNERARGAQGRLRADQRAGIRPLRRERAEAAARRKPCGECGKKIKYNYTDRPLCAECYPVVAARTRQEEAPARRRAARRRRVERKLAKAAAGVTGKHLMVAGSCWDCGASYVQVMYPNITSVIGFVSLPSSMRKPFFT